jgi:hypothetical protein
VDNGGILYHRPELRSLKENDDESGILFAPQMQVIFQSVHRVGRAATFIVVGLLICYAGYRRVLGRNFAARLQRRRISAEALHSRMQDGQPLNILDVRAFHKRLIAPL